MSKRRCCVVLSIEDKYTIDEDQRVEQSTAKGNVVQYSVNNDLLKESQCYKRRGSTCSHSEHRS